MRGYISRKTLFLSKIIPNFLILGGLLLLVVAYLPLIKDEAWLYLKQIKNQDYTLSADPNSQANNSVFSRFLGTNPIELYPINKDFSIIIEKIGVSAPINKDVPVTDEIAYIESLKTGIAHASISEYPSKDPGNVFLFAHASVDFWRLGKYATVFNLLRKLSIGDRIHVFYEGKDYVYETANKETVPGWNTYPLTRPTIEPTLTLQTCDPPGTTLNRLVVTAKLVDVRE